MGHSAPRVVAKPRAKNQTPGRPRMFQFQRDANHTLAPFEFLDCQRGNVRSVFDAGLRDLDDRFRNVQCEIRRSSERSVSAAAEAQSARNTQNRKGPPHSDPLPVTILFGMKCQPRRCLLKGIGVQGGVRITTAQSATNFPVDAIYGSADLPKRPGMPIFPACVHLSFACRPGHNGPGRPRLAP